MAQHRTGARIRETINRPVRIPKPARRMTRTGRQRQSDIRKLGKRS